MAIEVPRDEVYREPRQRIGDFTFDRSVAGELGKTLSGTTFHWRRLIVKEYGTPAGWIAVLCGVTLYSLWSDAD